MKKKNTRGIERFWKIFAIYGGGLAAVVLILLFILHGILKDYEKSMPNNTMDKIVGMFTNDNIQSLLEENNVNINEFESAEVIVEYLTKKMDAGDISYKRKNGEFTNTTPVYLVMAGDTSIAKVTLVEKGKNAHKFTEWKLGTVSFDEFIEAEHEYTITAPSDATVKLNGIAVNETYAEKKDITFDPAKNVGEFVTVPTLTEYRVKGLLAEPAITAEMNGKELHVKLDGKKCSIGYPEDEELLAQQKQKISDINQAYGKYIINRGSLSKLNSYMVGRAKTYMSDIPAVWAFLYGKEYTYEFRNESITNPVRYSDDLFSCEIYYDLYVKWSNGDTTYNTNMIYTFVKIKDEWKLADFSIK